MENAVEHGPQRLNLYELLDPSFFSNDSLLDEETLKKITSQIDDFATNIEKNESFLISLDPDDVNNIIFLNNVFLIYLHLYQNKDKDSKTENYLEVMSSIKRNIEQIHDKLTTQNNDDTVPIRLDLDKPYHESKIKRKEITRNQALSNIIKLLGVILGKNFIDSADFIRIASELQNHPAKNVSYKNIPITLLDKETLRIILGLGDLEEIDLTIYRLLKEIHSKAHLQQES